MTVKHDISLRALNTFGIDVRCRRFVEFGGAGDLEEAFADRVLSGGRWDVLGGGSNVIFTADYDGTLLHPIGGGIGVVSHGSGKVRVRASAGVPWDDFTHWCADRGLWGVENLAGIPGTVGACPVQNIGAYGAEAKDVIAGVEYFDAREHTTATLSAGDCEFGYRDSIFKRSLRGAAVITAVDFTLSSVPAPRLDYADVALRVAGAGGPTLTNIRNAIKEIRDSKLPDPAVTGNAGSFFKNPVVDDTRVRDLLTRYPDMPVYPSGQAGRSKLAAGWLIDRCGWKGKSMGRVGVHGRQALVLVNLGGASGSEVVALARAIQDDVRRRFGVTIETEVNIL